MTRRKKLFGSVLFAVAAMAISLTAYTDDQKTDSAGTTSTIISYTNTVQAQLETWTCSGITLMEGDAATLVASGEWSVNPGRPCDSGGNGTPADGGGQPALTDVNEGCLIVGRNQNGVYVETYHFTGNKAPVYVQKPEEICFLANDYHHPKHGAGYKDNTGTLTVTIKIRTVHPEHYPPSP